MDDPVESLAPFPAVVSGVLGSRLPGFHPRLDDSEDRAEVMTDIRPELPQRVAVLVTMAFPDAADACPVG